MFFVVQSVMLLHVCQYVFIMRRKTHCLGISLVDFLENEIVEFGSSLVLFYTTYFTVIAKTLTWIPVAK